MDNLAQPEPPPTTPLLFNGLEKGNYFHQLCSETVFAFDFGARGTDLSVKWSLSETNHANPH